MPSVDFVVETKVSTSLRAKQLEAMFDVPPAEKCSLRWTGELPIEAESWNVGLIVGPSGSGKTSIARQVFGEHYHPPLKWGADGVVDDFDSRFSMAEISSVCSAVGFNTIPAWMRPYRVLSNGEQFRVELARRLLELPNPIVVDEFTSVVDRQVAQIGAHAVQKYVRRNDRRFVAVSCHYDIIDWLQPDWILEPATMAFTPRRGLQCGGSRPKLDVDITRVDYEAWRLFAPFHYLTAELHKGAQCFVLFVGDRPASFAANLFRPHARVNDIWGCSRLVTLPDWQGLGLAMILIDRLGAAYRAIGRRLHTYPAHPSLIRSFDKSPNWKLEKRPGTYSTPTRSQLDIRTGKSTIPGKMGGRPCAVFSYCGAIVEDRDAAKQLIEGT